MSVSTITFNEAITMLQAMFANVDAEVLREVLIANNGHMERTVETLLSMTSATPSTDDRNNGSAIETQSPSQLSQGQGDPAPLAAGTVLPSDFLQIPELSSNRAAPSPSPVSPLPSGNAGGPQSGQLDQDYQMALMLQRQEYEAHAREDDARREAQPQARQTSSQNLEDTDDQAAAADIDFGPLKEKFTQLSTTAKNKFLQLKQKYFSGRGGSRNHGSSSSSSLSSTRPSGAGHQYQVVDQTDRYNAEGGAALRHNNANVPIPTDEEQQRQQLEFDFESHNTSLLEESNRNKTKRD